MTHRKPRNRNPYARDLADDKYRQRIKPARRKTWRPKHANRIFDEMAEDEDDEPEIQ